MPYSSVSDLPSSIKKLPDKKQRQWLSVFNGAYKRAKEDGKSAKDAESSAFAQANGVVKKKKGLKDMKLVEKFIDTVRNLGIHEEKLYTENTYTGCKSDDIYKVGIYDPATGEMRPHTIDTEDTYESKSSTHVDYDETGTDTTGETATRSTFRTNVIIKGIDKREWIVYGEVMVPTAEGELVEDQFVGEVRKTDAHDHFTTSAEIRKAMIGFMEQLHYSKDHPHNIQHDNSQPEPDTVII